MLPIRKRDPVRVGVPFHDEQLFELARTGKRDQVRAVVTYFRDARPGLVPRDEYRCGPLHHAAYFGNVDACEEIMATAPRAWWEGSLDRDGRSPLHYAVWQGHSRCWPLLLNAGFDANNANVDGVSMVHLAASRGDAPCVKALIGAKADVSTFEYGQMRTPLHLAAVVGSVECVQALLDAGAAVDEKDANHVTPLTYAISRGHRACSRLLYDAGASPAHVAPTVPVPLWLYATEDPDADDDADYRPPPPHSGDAALRRTNHFGGCPTCKENGIENPDHKTIRSRKCPYRKQ